MVIVRIILNSCLFALGLLIGPNWACADFNSDAVGTSTANFLKLGVGARAVAMGEAYSAIANDATALYWNPAGLVRIEKNAAALMYAPYLDSSFYNYGAYIRRVGRHACGVGIQFFSSGNIPETDENNASLGTFAPHDLAISVGYAYRLTEHPGREGVGVGGTVKLVRSTIINTAQTVALDVGIQSGPYFDHLRLALALTNMGGRLTFEQDSENLPRRLRYGGSFAITEAWLASLDLVSPRDNQTYAAFGTEYTWHLRKGLALSGRLGYNSRTASDIDSVTGLSFGFGIESKIVSFDYALLPYGGLGLTHGISLDFKW
ncbi:MAG: PorV/PorQ family protein [Elusimicrobia bacterium]|nr:PorV/PorQ family protein [Elusimicrobiota bacterium]